MTGAEKITARILDEARQQARANVERAEKEAADIIHDAHKEAEVKRSSIIEKAKGEAAEHKKRLISVAELEARKQKLQAKQEMIEEAFAKTLERLNSLSAAKYEGIIADMILDSVSTGNEEVILSSRDRSRLSPEFAAGINKRLAGRGIKGNITISDETRDINGGFILKTGDIEVNNSFEAIIKMQRDELEEKIVKILF